MVTNKQTNKQTTNQVILVQACSWQVRRQSFAILVFCNNKNNCNKKDNGSISSINARMFFLSYVRAHYAIQCVYNLAYVVFWTSTNSLINVNMSTVQEIILQWVLMHWIDGLISLHFRKLTFQSDYLSKGLQSIWNLDFACLLVSLAQFAFIKSKYENGEGRPYYSQPKSLSRTPRGLVGLHDTNHGQQTCPAAMNILSGWDLFNPSSTNFMCTLSILLFLW